MPREFKESSFSVYHDFCLWKIVCGYVMIGNSEYSRKIDSEEGNGSCVKVVF